jgi:transposase-like protein
LGFWTALREVFATTQEQRCWVHKTMNVLNAMPQSIQAKAKAHLHDIWQAETKAKANTAFDFFVETYGVKWDKAVAKLVKDRAALLTFYDFPAERAQALASTSGRQIRSKAPSPPSGTAPNAPRGVSAERPDWQWPSS